MAAYKDEQRGTWYVSFHYYDWTGKNCRKVKRGFKTKREATEWERHFRMKEAADLDMTFEEFVQAYTRDMKPKLKHNTWLTKEHILRTKLLPYFKDKKMRDIRPKDIIQWQNEMQTKGFSESYLRMIQNQLTSLFTHASRIYDLHTNPCKKVKRMGNSDSRSLDFWTTEEYQQFIQTIEPGTRYYLIFEILFWTGCRIGELLALTPADIDFEDKTIRINKTYNTKEKKNGPTKTYASTRTISVPDFLLADIKDYMNSVYGLTKHDRLFQVTKYYMEHEKERALKNSGIEHIRIHDLRHSHCALLFEMGIAPLEVKERLGHKNIETTLNVYAHVYPDKQRKLSDKLDKVYKEGLHNGDEE